VERTSGTVAPSRQLGARGNVSWLPSGAARVTVYGGIDQLTGKRLQLRETVPAQATRRETEKVQTKLLNQVDERRSPKTEATVNELLDRWLDVIDGGYVGKIEKHIRPSIGRLQVGRARGGHDRGPVRPPTALPGPLQGREVPAAPHGRRTRLRRAQRPTQVREDHDR
jgi:hypothetical protein